MNAEDDNKSGILSGEFDMKQYAIAYLDSHGEGHSVLEPYIFDDINSLEDGKAQQKKMTNMGFRQVKLFWYEDELPEYITWNFVLMQKVTT